MSLLSLFLESTFLVKLIFLLLISLSIISWAIIIQRLYLFKHILKNMIVFENKFWSVTKLSFLYQEILLNHRYTIGLEKVFQAGFKEFSRLQQENRQVPEAILKGTTRTMKIFMSQEIEEMETHIPFLGTIASISPYIGLLGTIWGIMHAFFEISHSSHSVILKIVAPGIAESLVSTALGLFTAIPAVAGYHYLNQYMNKLELQYDKFIKEFIVILHRQVFSKDNKG